MILLTPDRCNQLHRPGWLLGRHAGPLERQAQAALSCHIAHPCPGNPCPATCGAAVASSQLEAQQGRAETGAQLRGDAVSGYKGGPCCSCSHHPVQLGGGNPTSCQCLLPRSGGCLVVTTA